MGGIYEFYITIILIKLLGFNFLEWLPYLLKSRFSTCVLLFTPICILILYIVNFIIYARKLSMLIIHVPMHLYFVLFIVYYTYMSAGFLELGRLFTSRCQLLLECIVYRFREDFLIYYIYSYVQS